MIAKVIEGTILAIVLYLVLSHAGEFYTVAQAVGQTYVAGVQVLQGR